jgi:hypothetical protein
MSYTKATVRPIEKGFELVLGERVIGTSKTDFDARFHMHAINDALDVAFLEGQKYLERMVEKTRQELEFQKAMFQIQAETAKQKYHLSFCGWCRQGLKCPYGG